MTTCQFRRRWWNRPCGVASPCPTHQPAAALRARMVADTEARAARAADQIRRRDVENAALLDVTSPVSPLNPIHTAGWTSGHDAPSSHSHDSGGYSSGGYTGSSDSGSSSCGGGGGE